MLMCLIIAHDAGVSNNSTWCCFITDVDGVTDICDDLSMNCTTNKGHYYLPLQSDHFTNSVNNSLHNEQQIDSYHVSILF